MKSSKLRPPKLLISAAVVTVAIAGISSHRGFEVMSTPSAFRPYCQISASGKSLTCISPCKIPVQVLAPSPPSTQQYHRNRGLDPKQVVLQKNKKENKDSRCVAVNSGNSPPFPLASKNSYTSFAVLVPCNICPFSSSLSTS